MVEEGEEEVEEEEKEVPTPAPTMADEEGEDSYEMPTYLSEEKEEDTYEMDGETTTVRDEEEGEEYEEPTPSPVGQPDPATPLDEPSNPGEATFSPSVDPPAPTGGDCNDPVAAFGPCGGSDTTRAPRAAGPATIAKCWRNATPRWVFAHDQGLHYIAPCPPPTSLYDLL